MTLEKNSLQRRGWMVSFVAAFWATGCGGSAFIGGADGGAGAGGAGATSGSAGSAAAGSGGATPICEGAACPLLACAGGSVFKPGRCCPVCDGGGGAPAGGASGAPAGGASGAPAGGAAAGGVSGVGGSGGGCGNVACPAVACDSGWVSVYPPDACCPTCVFEGDGGTGGGNVCDVACPLIACGKGFTFSPSGCCGSCVPDDACTLGQQGYETLQAQLIAQPGAVACKVDQDCALLQGNAYCGNACAEVPVNAAALQSIAEQLSTYATNDCSTCTPVQPPCAAPLPAICNQGQCVAGAYL